MPSIQNLTKPDAHSTVLGAVAGIGNGRGFTGQDSANLNSTLKDIKYKSRDGSDLTLGRFLTNPRTFYSLTEKYIRWKVSNTCLMPSFPRVKI